LNQRKSAHTQRDIEILSKEFGLDLDKVESLVRFVTSPSVIGTAIHSVGKVEKNLCPQRFGLILS